MLDYKNVEVSWLFETDLTNMNAGEGSTNLKEIKSYNNGLPYISGQSMRHALRESIRREHKRDFKCTPEYPCGDIEDCWTCDLFGYLLPSEGSKRWSPIKAAPALGQIRRDITTDLIFRMVEDIKCPECGDSIYPLAARDGEKTIEKDKPLKCPNCDKQFKAPYSIRQAIAYKQLINNIYKTNLSIDLANLGVEEVPKVDFDKDKLDGVEEIKKIDDDEKLKRVISILNGIYNLADFANQSREMVNASPDFVVIGLQKQYNHRLASTLKMDESGNINIGQFVSVINDVLKMEGTEIYVGLIKGIISNESELINVLNELEENNSGFINCDGPRDAFNQAIASLSGDNNGSH